MKFLQDDNGNNSSLRLAMAAWLFLVLFIWAGISIYKGAMQDIPASVGTMIGLLLSAKVAQKYVEPGKPEITDEAAKNGSV